MIIICYLMVKCIAIKPLINLDPNIINPYAIALAHFITGTAMTQKLQPELEASATNSIVTAHISSATLFAGKRELLIAHGGEHYRLRLTNQGKLILTK